MKHQLIRILFAPFFFLGLHLPLFASLAPGTLVLTPHGSIPIEQLKVGDTVITPRKQGKGEAKIGMIREVSHTSQYRLDTVCGAIYASPDHLFYDPLLQKWVAAQDITTHTVLLDKEGKYICCVAHEHIKGPFLGYDITLESPHIFYIAEGHILTHNFVPLVVIGISFAFGDGIVVTGFGAGLGALGFGLWKHFRDKKELKFAQIEQELASATGGGSPEDPEKNRKIIKVDNMDEFFKTDFGRKIQSSVEKTNKKYQGQSVYRVKEKMPEYGLKKGDQLYLDSLHKDHLEVFRKNGTCKKVLNLDGTANARKLVTARSRKL